MPAFPLFGMGTCPPPEKIDNALRERDSPQEIRRAAAISAQEIFRAS